MEVSAPAAFPRERTSVPYWIRGCVGYLFGVDNLEKRKISCPYQDLKPQSP